MIISQVLTSIFVNLYFQNWLFPTWNFPIGEQTKVGFQMA